MKEIVLEILKILALRVIKKHKPFVVGITGTVGKTTTSHFVYEFLRAIYKDDAFASTYNYNGEFGIPLTILLSKSPKKNPFRWLYVFFKGFFLAYSKKYPKYIVLEYGIDHDGEMDFLLEIARPNVGIILNISKNHVLQFPDFEIYKREKLKLPLNSKKIIYNLDDVNIEKKFGEIENENMISFGIKNEKSQFKAKNIKSDVDKLRFTLEYLGKDYDLEFDITGDHQIYNILPVFALGAILGIDMADIKEVLSDIHPPKGRGVILKGVNESIIIDGSYNGGFTSISSGILYLNSLEGDVNKILVLGDMRELGQESKNLHLSLADLINATEIKYVILVGEEMKKYAFPEIYEKFGDNTFSFLDSRLAGKKTREIIQQNEKKSVIFVKGSQNTIYLEEGIKEFLFDLRDVNKLCRQSDYWMKKKYEFFTDILGENNNGYTE